MGRDHSNDNNDDQNSDLPDPRRTTSAAKPKTSAKKAKKQSRFRPPPAKTDGDADTTKTVQVKGRRLRIHQRTTVHQIKKQVGVSDDNLAYLRTDDDLKALNDGDRPYEHVDDGDRLTFRPGAKKNPFGHR